MFSSTGKNHELALKLSSIVLIILAVCRIGIDILDCISFSDSAIASEPIATNLVIVTMAVAVIFSLAMLAMGIMGLSHVKGREISAHIKLAKVMLVLFGIGVVSALLSSFQGSFQYGDVFDPVLCFLTTFTFRSEAKALTEERSRR